MKNKETFSNISFIKTIMMIVVVLYHSCIFFTEPWLSNYEPQYKVNYLNNFVFLLKSFHIQTFIAMSGFLFYHYKVKKRKYNNLVVDVKKRFNRLIIPYIFTSIFWVIPIYIYFYGFNIKRIIIKYFLMVSPSQLWFLIMLFVLFVLFDMCLYKIKISKVWLLLVYFISIVIGIILDNFDIYIFQISRVLKYTLYFYFGEYLYIYKDKLKLKQIIILIILSIPLYVLIVSIKNIDSILLNYLVLFMTPLLSIIEITIIFYVCAYITDNKKLNLDNKIYKLFKDNSFGIYLFHQQIIYFTIVIFNGVVHPLTQVILSFIISLLISLLMSIILKKKKITKFMFGL